MYDFFRFGLWLPYCSDLVFLVDLSFDCFYLCFSLFVSWIAV